MATKDRLRRIVRALPGSELIFTAWRSWRFPRLYDAFIVSYPKSGRTWLRLMLGRVCCCHFGVEDPGDLMELLELAGRHPGIPRIKIHHEDDPQLRTPEELPSSKREYRRNKVVCLVRDPRDVLVSNYFQATRRECYFKGSLSDFVRHPRYGCPSLLRYMSIWYENREVPAGFLLVRYEDLHKDPSGQLRRVLAFLGLDDVSPDAVLDAVEFASFDNMKQMEAGDAMGSGRLRAADVTDPESRKVRRGKVGGYVDYLGAADLAYVNALMRDQLPDFFGYAPSPGQ